jgi:hypothetical protein
MTNKVSQEGAERLVQKIAGVFSDPKEQKFVEQVIRETYRIGFQEATLLAMLGMHPMQDMFIKSETERKNLQ